jgi:predicted  nucleic acid-binding Zn-ribbon protein
VAVTDSEAERTRLAAELRTANLQLADVELTNRRLRNQIRAARDNEKRLQKELRAIRTSFSWRITYPVRAFLRRYKRRKF